MGLIAAAFLVASLQDAPMGPPVPPEPSNEMTVSFPVAEQPLPKIELPKESGRIIPPSNETRSGSGRLVERPEYGPQLGGFVLWTGVVLALLVGTFLLLRRFGRGSRFMAGGGAINVLARKPLSQKQEIFLVEVGSKVFLVGSTKDRLNTLGEFDNPDEIAALRASLPQRREDSLRLTFQQSLREGIREEEKPAPARVYASIADELSAIKKTVRAWRA